VTECVKYQYWIPCGDGVCQVIIIVANGRPTIFVYAPSFSIAYTEFFNGISVLLKDAYMSFSIGKNDMTHNSFLDSLERFLRRSDAERVEVREC